MERRSAAPEGEPARRSRFRDHGAMARLTGRVREAAPLLAIGAAFLAGALVASLDRIRVFDSVYPLWILLALNGGIAAIAGSAVLVVEDPDRPFDDDPTVVRVPRVQWESLLRRLEAVSRTPAPRPAAAVPEWAEGSMPSLAAAPAMAPPPRRRRGSPSPPSGSRPAPIPSERPSSPTGAVLRRELDSLEVQGLAASALATSEALGNQELGALLSSSFDELLQVAARWEVPAVAGEGADALLVRLVRQIADRPELYAGRRSVEEIRGMADRLERLRAPGASGPGVTGGPIGTPEDEVERLLQELEASRSVRKGRPPGGGGGSDPGERRSG